MCLSDCLNWFEEREARSIRRPDMWLTVFTAQEVTALILLRGVNELDP